MKKLLFALSLLVASTAFVACGDDDDDKVLNFNELPANAQSFINQHFSGVTVVRVEGDNDSYDVYLDGFEVDFTKSGEWDSVKSRGKAIPASVLSLLPEGILTYVASTHAGATIIEIDKEAAFYDIDISLGLELIFDLNGNFLRYDR